MIIKLTYVFGSVQMFKIDNYVIAPIKDTKPEIVKVEVLNDSGKRLYKKERHFKWFYERFKYKPAPTQENANADEDLPELQAEPENAAAEKPAEKAM